MRPQAPLLARPLDRIADLELCFREPAPAETALRTGLGSQPVRVGSSKRASSDIDTPTRFWRTIPAAPSPSWTAPGISRACDQRVLWRHWQGVARPAGVTPAVGTDGHRYGPRSRPGLLLLLREGAPISKSDRPCPKGSRTAPPERPATVAQCFRGGRKHSSSGDMDCGWRVGLIRFQICAKARPSWRPIAKVRRLDAGV